MESLCLRVLLALGVQATAGAADPVPSFFRAAKGPDFLSRLRGYVNILGPNPAYEGDRFAIIRRAILLHSFLRRKAEHLFQFGRAEVSEPVLRALLRVPEYLHGARSMEAILDMSLLSGRRRFEAADLPTLEQLRLHVSDPDGFHRLLARDVDLGARRETLAKGAHSAYVLGEFKSRSRAESPGLSEEQIEQMAQAAHESYLQGQAGDAAAANKPALLLWDDLPEEYRDSNRQQVDDIPRKLRAIGCDFEPVPEGESVELIAITPEEVTKMAEMEHERWLAEKKLKGWTRGNDPKNRTNPLMVPWEELDKKTHESNREIVRIIPQLMKDAGFRVYRQGAPRVS